MFSLLRVSMKIIETLFFLLDIRHSIPGRQRLLSHVHLLSRGERSGIKTESLFVFIKQITLFSFDSRSLFDVIKLFLLWHFK